MAHRSFHDRVSPRPFIANRVEQGDRHQRQDELAGTAYEALQKRLRSQKGVMNGLRFDSHLEIYTLEVGKTFDLGVLQAEFPGLKFDKYDATNQWLADASKAAPKYLKFKAAALEAALGFQKASPTPLASPGL